MGVQTNIKCPRFISVEVAVLSDKSSQGWQRGMLAQLAPPLEQPRFQGDVWAFPLAQQQVVRRQ